jgi:hypothetical protein
MKWLFSFCLFLSFTVHAESLTSSQSNRANTNHTMMLGTEILSTWLPFKFTGSYIYTLNNKWSFEAEAARGKFGAQALIFDVASVTEYRYSLLARRYVGNSFNWIIGLYKDDFHAKIGSDILDDMSNTSIDDLRVEVVGLVLGLGNRWQWQNGFTFGVDWFRLNAPIFDHQVKDGIVDNIEDENDRDLVKSGIRKVANIPTFVFFGLYFGYSF